MPTIRNRVNTKFPALRLAQAKRLAALVAKGSPKEEIPSGAQIYYAGGPTLGCDPEFFFEQDGKVIGAEKVIGERLRADQRGSTSNGFVMDGVQIELNPPASHCREGLGGNISAAFRALREHLKTRPEIKASFTTCINLDKKELDSLSDKAKALGCLPSLNRADAKADVTVNGATSLKRSAGGHIHLGLTGDPKFMQAGVRERLVDLLDILVGNTCVLLDRDPLAPERRKVYGRAGEYRLPKHGLEYRVLSNFWLRHYILMSFVMGASRNAHSILSHTLMQEWFKQQAYSGYKSYMWDAEAELLRLVGGKDGLKLVRKAINTNDYALAKANFERIWPFIEKYFDVSTSGFSPSMKANFDLFHTLIKTKGIEAFFPDDPLEQWCNVRITGAGWESFMSNRLNTFDKPNIERIKALPDKPTLRVNGAKRAS